MMKINNERLWVPEGIEGRWFGPLWKAANAFIQSFSCLVNGEVTYTIELNRMTLKSLKVEKPL
jgi:argininosuccinate synthase